MNLATLVMPPWVSAALAFFKATWWIWAILAVVAYAGFEINKFGDRRYAAGRADEHAEALRAQARADALANAELAREHAKADADRVAAELDLKRQAEEHARELIALKGRLPSYVSPLRLSSFPAFPLGFVRYAADAASFANGDGSALERSPAVTDDEPSGVSLSAWGEYVADQAAAYRSCTTWGVAWRDYAARLKSECQSIITTLKGSSP